MMLGRKIISSKINISSRVVHRQYTIDMPISIYPYATSNISLHNIGVKAIPAINSNSMLPSSFKVMLTFISQVNHSIFKNMNTAINELFNNSIYLLKRTFQPSLLRRKRKHGFLKRIETKDGRHILNHRRSKGRRSLCP